MKKSILTLLLLFVCLAGFSQREQIVQGYIYDAKTKQPIEFANVGIVSKAIGTVSKKSGFFGFTYDDSDVSLNDRLQISILGYEKFNMSLGRYRGLHGEDRVKIYLKPVATELEVVSITNVERKYETIGAQNLDSRTIGYWKDKKGLGGELATRVRIKRQRTKLLNLNFKISENLSDSLRIRINIYDYSNRMPGKNILAKPIYTTIKKDYGAETIDLKPYNIIVDEDVVVSLELIEIYGKKIGLALFGSMDSGTAYTRLVSQDNWKRYDDVGMGFWMDISRPKGSGKAKEIRREAPEGMLLLWDASAASANRNIEEELELLNLYIRKQKNVDIMAVKFAMGYREQKRMTVNRKNWEEFMAYLKDTEYDGDSDFKALKEDFGFKGDVAMLFSNGISATSQLADRFEVPLFAVNTNTLAANAELKDVCRLSGGHYLNLEKMNLEQAMRYLTYDLNDNLRYPSRGELAQTGSVFGQVRNEAEVLAGAYLNVLGSFESAVSDAEGNYRIDAEIGDIIKVDYLGMKPKQFVVEQLGKTNVVMETDGELLDEVLVEANLEPEPQEIVDTPFGRRSFNSLGYSIQGITREDIGPQHTQLDQLIAKLPGVVIKGLGDEKRYMFARLMVGSITLDANPIIVVDGIIYEQGPDFPPLDQQLPPIDLQSIEKIDVLKSVVATNRYGSQGGYGAIVIKTEGSSMKFGKEKKTPSALATANDFTEDLPRLEDALNEPEYVLRYQNTANLKEAKALYKSYKSKSGMQSVPFFVNSAKYFRTVDGRFAKRVLSNLAVLAPNNVMVLKTYAFWLEENQQFKRAAEIYNTIYTLEPLRAQHLYSLAQCQARAGQYEQALENFKRLLYNQTEGVNFDQVAEDAELELKRLLNLHKEKLDTANLPAWLFDNAFKQKIRIVFEWNDPLSEFELQFVNPQKKFFIWSFDSFSNKKQMASYRKDGVFMESFEIPGEADGIWQLNLRNIGAANIRNPAQLKYTVYMNYGTPYESHRTKVVNLAELPAKVVLDRFTNKR